MGTAYNIIVYFCYDVCIQDDYIILMACCKTTVIITDVPIILLKSYSNNIETYAYNNYYVLLTNTK